MKSKDSTTGKEDQRPQGSHAHSSPMEACPGLLTRGQASLIARSTGILAGATGLSRLLGFARDLLLAGLFGTLAQAQAFVVAFRLPNLFRELVAEGAVSSAVVPVLSRYRAKGEEQTFWQLCQALLVQWAVLLVVLGIAGTLAASHLVRLIAPGFAEEPEKFALTVQLTRILFPLIVLIGLWSYFMGLLNSLRHFTAPALGPAILNLSMIVACVWFVPRTTPGILAVAIGVIVGAVIQLAIQVPVARALGFRWRLLWKHRGSNEILRLLGPRLLGSGVYQANVLIHTALASLSAIVGSGAVAALYFANRLVQLPLALFGTASAQASLPSMTEQATTGDMEGFRSTILMVIRMVAFTVFPSAIGLMVLAHPIVSGLFERGAFDTYSTDMTCYALVFYAVGLLPYAVGKIITGSFYAIQDTWTPAKLAIEAVVINVALSVILMWPMQIGGLALSAAIASSLNALHLTRRMEKRIAMPLLRPLSRALFRIAAASLLMGLSCCLAWAAVMSRMHLWLALPSVIALGIVVYAASCWFLRVRELSSALRWCKILPTVGQF